MIFEKQIVAAYKNMMYTRCDDTRSVFYYSAEDFSLLKSESHSFLSSSKDKLQGYFYSYENYIDNKLVVFDHGFGGGHRAYMKEIEMLCRHGYLVFAYDHTGCMESGGKSPNGLSHSLCDLNDCINHIKSLEHFSSFEIMVVGHSWGAFSTLNIVALHPEISHIVAMCGFVSVKEMIKTFFPGIMKGYRRAVLELERESNPEFCDYDAVNSLSQSNVKALLIYSENDNLCRPIHYEIAKQALENKDNINFMLVKNKGHNPNYTEEAVNLLGEFTKARAKFLKKKKTTDKDAEEFVASFNWEKITEQDENIWAEIFEHLNK